MLLERVRTVAERGISRRAFRGIELAVSCDGDAPSALRLGQAGGRLWTCASKCLLAVAVARLVSDGVVSYDGNLGHHLPELAGTGWGPSTLRDVLSHSVGVTADIGVLSACLPDEEVLRHCAVNPPDPASAPVYTRWTGAFLVGQVIARVTGQALGAYLLDEIGGQLGLTETQLSYPAACLPQLTESIRPLLAAAQLKAAGSAPAQTVHVRDDRVWPGVSGSGPMTDLVRVLAALLPARAEAAGLVSPAVAREVTSVHRQGTSGRLGDDSLAWGLGVAVDQRLALPKCSPGTFGHFGENGAVLVFADPGQDLVAGLRLIGSGGETGIAMPLRRAAIVAALLADVQDGRGGTQKPKSVSLRLSH